MGGPMRRRPSAEFRAQRAELGERHGAPAARSGPSVRGLDPQLVGSGGQRQLGEAPSRRAQRQHRPPGLAAAGQRRGDARAGSDELDGRRADALAGDDQCRTAVGRETGVGHRGPFEGRDSASIPARIARYTLRVLPPSRNAWTRALSARDALDSALALGGIREHTGKLRSGSAPVARPAVARDVAVRAVEAAPAGVLLEIRGEEDDRQRNQRGVERERRVVGDQHVEPGEERRHVGSEVAAEAPDRGRWRTAARSRPRRADAIAPASTASRRLEHVQERAPVLVPRAPPGRRRHRATSVRTARGAVPASTGPTARSMLGPRGRAALVGRALRQHVDPRLPRHRHAIVGERERRLEAPAHQVRGGGKNVDPAGGAAEHAAEKSPAEPGTRRPRRGSPAAAASRASRGRSASAGFRATAAR